MGWGSVLRLRFYEDHGGIETMEFKSYTDRQYHGPTVAGRNSLGTFCSGYDLLTFPHRIAQMSCHCPCLAIAVLSTDAFESLPHATSQFACL